MFHFFKKNFQSFPKYALVGVTGTLIDLASLYVFIEFFNFSVILAAVLAFLLAASNNFILNKNWTFRNTSKNYRKLYLKFLIVSLVGLLLTVSAMHVLVNILDLWYMVAKVMTSLLVLTWNFLGNKFWTFQTKIKTFHYSQKSAYTLSIIIPAYNEENRIQKTLEHIQNYIHQQNMKAEMIVVDDGSLDKTIQVVQAFQEKNPAIKLLALEKNKGKGFAVKTGVEKADGDYILFTDADNSTPIEEYENLLQAMTSEHYDIAIGSRYLHNSQVQIKQSFLRVSIGRIGNFFIRLFLMNDIQDTQCGFKLFTKESAKNIFAKQKIHRWGFDMEALAVATLFEYKIKEVPVSWFNSSDSRVRPVRDAIKTFTELLYIKMNLITGRYKD